MTTTLNPLTLRGIRDLVRPLTPTATIYLGPKPGAPTVDAGEDLVLRWRAIASYLAALGAPASTVDTAQACVRSLPVHGAEIAIVVDGSNVALCQPIPGGTPLDRARYGAPAHVLPLLSWLQHHPPYVEVLIDRAGAEVTSVPGGTMSGITRSVDGPDDEIERNAPGGWAQPRYQRRAEDSWRHNAAAVADVAAEALRRVGAELLLVAGDVRAVPLLCEKLPERVRPVVVRPLPGGRHADGSSPARDAAIAAQLTAYADEKSTAIRAAFDADRGPHGRAVEGVTNTLTALAAGRVRTLLVADDPGDDRIAWFGPDTLCVDESSVPAGAARASLRSGRLVDVAVRAAMLTDAEVRVVAGAEAAGQAEGIGALCRFPA